MKSVGLLVIVSLFLCVTANAERTVWYVHPDSALNTIQAGLDSCADYDIVLVGPGIYYENIVWPNTQGIHLVSELGSEVTIIDGNQVANVISCTTLVDSTTVIAGFTIQHGNVRGIHCTNASPTVIDNCIKENSHFDGIGCYGWSSPIIVYNTITNNTSSGIRCRDSSSPIIANNVITYNHGNAYGGGICCCGNSSPTITNNTITGNSVEEIFPLRGGGIYCGSGSSPVITYNTITGNGVFPGSGGGICCWESVGAEIIGNTISGNISAGNGGGICCISDISTIIASNIIIDNSAEKGWLVPGSGGGIDVWNSSPTLTSNTISMNSAHGNGAGVYARGTASPLIEHCTIANNNGDGVYCCDASAPIAHNCDITGNIGYGVCNVNSLVIMNAESNWWGDATGPYHPTANPGGLGDTVSDYVDFDPWLTIPGVEEQPIVKPIEQRANLATTIFRGPLRLPEGKKCRVFDIAGRVVEPNKIQPGIYFVEVDGVVTQKVVKVR